MFGDALAPAESREPVVASGKRGCWLPGAAPLYRRRIGETREVIMHISRVEEPAPPVHLTIRIQFLTIAVVFGRWGRGYDDAGSRWGPPYHPISHHLPSPVKRSGHPEHHHTHRPSPRASKGVVLANSYWCGVAASWPWRGSPRGRVLPDTVPGEKYYYARGRRTLSPHPARCATKPDGTHPIEKIAYGSAWGRVALGGPRA